jgi:hypothetical protein
VTTTSMNGPDHHIREDWTLNGDGIHPTAWTVRKPLNRLVVVLGDISQMVFQEGLNVDEAFGEGLQDGQHGSFFVITGDSDGIERLRCRLTDDSLLQEGTKSVTDKTFEPQVTLVDDQDIEMLRRLENVHPERRHEFVRELDGELQRFVRFYFHLHRERRPDFLKLLTGRSPPPGAK